MAIASLLPTDFTTERRLKRAVQHVGSFWIPIHPTILEAVRHAALEHDIAAVRQHLLKDPGLYLYVCREQAKEGISIFHSPCFEDVKRFLPVESKVVSPHRFEESADIHLLKQRELSASLAAVLELSASFDVDDKVAYLTMLFRSLGMQLILWNYNDLYAQSLSEVRPSDSLESILTRRLGFSPTMLAVKVVSEWGLSDEVFQSISSSGALSPLQQLCTVGEAFARAAMPELYPTAAKDWSYAREEIIQRLGNDGIKKIENRYQEFVNALTAEAIPQSLSFDEEHFAKGKNTCFVPPKIIDLLPYYPREAFYEHYKILGKQHASDALRHLIATAWPTLGFEGMQIFTYDPPSRSLIKKTNIGSTWFTREVINLEELEISDPFVKVFSYGAELAAGSLSNEGESRSYLLLSFGETTPLGLLYLEGDFYLHDEGVRHKKREAKALQVALVDTLLS